MHQVIFCLNRKFGEGFIGPFQLIISGKVLLCVLLRSLDRVKGDGDFFIGVIVQAFEGFGFRFKTVSICLN